MARETTLKELVLSFAMLVLRRLTKSYAYFIINNQVVRKIKIAVENDVKNWAYISLR